MNEDTIPVEDVSYEGAPEASVESILKRWGVDEGTPSTDVEDDTPQETEETTEDDLEIEETEDSEKDPEEAPAEEPKAKRVVSEDDEVVVKVDGEEKRVSVKDLQRLYGQEASLTRKSQELAAHRKAAEEQGLVAMSVLEKMYQKAAEKAKPYENVDLFKASRELEPEEFDALRAEMNRAVEEKKFYEQELQGFVGKLREQQEAYIRQQAGVAIQALKQSIPNWNDQTYDELRSYAVGAGMHPDVVNRIVDPTALTLIHKARLYDQAKAKAATKTQTVTKAVPSRPSAKPSAAPVDGRGRPTAEKQAWNRYQSSGDIDDGVDALVNRWLKE
jgi:hypothetical protein